MGEEHTPETKFALHELRITNLEQDVSDMRKAREAERWWIIVTLIGALGSIAMQILPLLLKGVGK